MRKVLFLIGLMPLSGFAAEIGSGIAGSNVDILIEVVLGLGATILCIYLLSALAKRLLGGSVQGAGSLRVVTGISVGSRERVLVVQVNDEQLLIGVSPAGISKLHHLEDCIRPEKISAPAIPSALSQLFTGGRQS